MIKRAIDNFLIAKKLKVFFKELDKNNIKSNNNSLNILVEFNSFKSGHIYIALIARFLSKINHFNMIGFLNYSTSITSLNNSIFKKIKFIIGKFLKTNFFGIYKAIGVNKIICPTFTTLIKKRANEKFIEIYGAISSNDSVYDITIDNIKFGDLIYDGYLKENYTYNLDINSSKFKKYLHGVISIYFYWKNYFENNKVDYVIGVHGVYAYGIMLRLAVFKNIEVFTFLSGKIHRLNKKKFYQNREFEDYKKNFTKINNKTKEKAINITKKILGKKFQGEENTTFLWPMISSYSKKIDNSKKVLNNNSKFKILIATHNVKDSISCYGPTLFADFSKWLEFLANISKKTDYEWYIKDHPFYGKSYDEGQGGDKTKELTDYIVKNNENFFIIPSKTPNNKIINEKIDCVLTLYGSVAYEYAYFNIPVLTGSNNCPTINYDFNIHSKTKSEYEQNLMNLKNLKLEIKQNEITQYYFMRYIYNSFDHFFDGNSNFLKDNNIFDDYETDKFYNYLMKNLNQKKISEVECIFDNFLRSNDYHLNSSHSNINLDIILNRYQF